MIIKLKIHLKAYAKKKVALIRILSKAKRRLTLMVKVQREWRKHIKRPKKINVPRFKRIFEAFLLGWKTRRILSIVKQKPELKEVMDLIKLSGDLS